MAMLFFIYIFLIGCAIGSFLTVLIDRLPRGLSIGGRSHCDNCKKKLVIIDLIPIVSFLSTGRRCRYCHVRLSKKYLILEILSGVMFVAVFYFGYQTNGSFDVFSLRFMSIKILELVLAASCFVIFFSDVKYHIIPDSMQVVFGINAVLLRLITQGFSVQNGLSIALGTVICIPLLLIYLATKEKGMGFGDVKLSLVIGLLLSLKLGIAALYFAFISGAVVGVILLVFGKSKWKSKIAFGPFLLFGFVSALLFQTEILQFIKAYWMW